MAQELSIIGEVLPNWLAAIGTVGATGVAVYLAWTEKSRADAAEGQRDDLIEAERIRVASQVAGWMEPSPPPPVEAGRRPDRWRQPADSTRAYVKNGSDQTVTDVRAYVVHTDDACQEDLGSWGMIAPGETAHTDTQVEIGNYNIEPWLLLRFTDPTGRRWERGKDGRLQDPTPDRASAWHS